MLTVLCALQIAVKRHKALLLFAEAEVINAMAEVDR